MLAPSTRRRDERRMVDPKDMPSDTRAESADQPESDQATPEQRIAQLEEALKRKAEEATANFDRYLRAVAEAENFRKRMQKEKAEGIRYSNETLLRDVLRVIDNLELALEHARLGGDGSSVEEGVQLTLRLFRDVLDRHGVKEIDDPTGSTFDPSTQEATELQANREVPPNTVIRTRAKGYRYNDRLLRPARVVVASGPPSSAEPGEGENEPIH